MILDAVSTMTPEKRVGILQLLCPKDTAAAFGQMTPRSALSNLLEFQSRKDAERGTEKAVQEAEAKLDMEMFKAEHALHAAEEESEASEGGAFDVQGQEVSVDLSVVGRVELIEVSFIPDPEEGYTHELGIEMEGGKTPLVLGDVSGMAEEAGMRGGDTVLGFDGEDVHKMEVEREHTCTPHVERRERQPSHLICCLSARFIWLSFLQLSELSGRIQTLIEGNTEAM